MNLGMLGILFALIACDDDGIENVRHTYPSISYSPTISIIHPNSGGLGDAVTLLLQDMPENAQFEGLPTSDNALGGQPGPYVSAYFGNESAKIISGQGNVLVVQVPEYLAPGDYQVMIRVNGEEVLYKGGLFNIVDVIQ